VRVGHRQAPNPKALSAFADRAFLFSVPLKLR
jgi:hypothetical protein